MASRFNASYRGIGEMLRADFMQAAMRAKAEKVKAVAEATAPVMENGPHPGRYKGSFHVSSGVRDTGRGVRAYGRVENDSPEALFVEYGTRNNPRYRTLGRALDAAGGD